MHLFAVFLCPCNLLALIPLNLCDNLPNNTYHVLVLANRIRKANKPPPHHNLKPTLSAYPIESLELSVFYLNYL
ncbi:hypothetical protein ONZ45_g8137 [Pleurotus djamor]|nr:hypothetical protein ONZ45_g8137 [Pleurotus djamor]